MATVTNVTENAVHVGNRKKVTGTLTFTGTYVTGGESVPGSAVGLELALDDLDLDPAVVTGGSFATRWDKANNKVLLLANSDGSAAVNEPLPQLGAVAIPGGPATIRYRAWGLGSAAA